jgi:hypothetical protein
MMLENSIARGQGLTICKRLEVDMTDEQSRGELELASVPEIRRVWYKGEWFYSVVDVIAFLTGTKNPQSYWGVLKNRMKAEGYDVIPGQEPVAFNGTGLRNG